MCGGVSHCLLWVILSDGYGSDGAFLGVNLKHRGLKGRVLTCSMSPRIFLVVQISVPHDRMPVRAECYLILKSMQLCAPEDLICVLQHSCSSGQPFPVGPAYLNGLLHQAAYNPLVVLNILCGIHNAQACRPASVVSICSSVLVVVRMWFIVRIRLTSYGRCTKERILDQGKVTSHHYTVFNFKKSPNRNRTFKFQKEQESQNAYSLTVLSTNVTSWRCM